jgi:hypothetical protein
LDRRFSVKGQIDPSAAFDVPSELFPELKAAGRHDRRHDSGKVMLLVRENKQSLRGELRPDHKAQ